MSFVPDPFAHFSAELINLAGGCIDRTTGGFADLGDSRASFFLPVGIFLGKTWASLAVRLSSPSNSVGVLYI